MKYIEPLALTMESDDYIVVHALCDGEPVDYTFTCNRGPVITGLSQGSDFYFKTYNDPLAAFWLTNSTLDLLEAHDDKVTPPADETNPVQPVKIKLSTNSKDRTNYVVTFAATSDSRLEETFTVRGEAPIYTVDHNSYHWRALMEPREWEMSAEKSITPLLSAILSFHQARALK